jgi:RHS repeat-associated protein
VNANGTTCRHFYYDNSTGYSGSIPTGVTTPTNSSGRMIEAATDTCSSGTLITDEWFSYDKDGRMIELWEQTPNSGGYDVSTLSYYGNNAPDELNLYVLGSHWVTSLVYGLDGEGRLNTAIDDATTMVSGATYNAASQPTNVSIGSGTDYDGYAYDNNTSRMTGWTFQVNSVQETATPTWNPIGTLKSLAITDGFNSGGTQTCNFGNSSNEGYDDWNRLVYDDCGSGQWGQSFSYDQYDNLTKTVISGRTGVTWNPGYNLSNNQVTGASYDANGNMTNDGLTNTYAWNEFSKMKSTNGSGTNCSTGGECVTYDAFGRAMEIGSGGSYKQIWYTPLGKTGMVAGSTFVHANLPMPGGGTLYQLPSAAYYYQHKDWLGSSRLSSEVVSLTIEMDRAFAPYGETYQNFGATDEVNFTGDTQDIAAGMYDTPNRELAGSNQGRWLSPDPAGFGWNQYAYPSNPNSSIDPLGLFMLPPGGWGGGGGGCDPSDPSCGGGGCDDFGCDPGCDPDFGCGPILPPLPGGGGGSRGSSGSGTGGGIGGQGIFPGEDCPFCYSLGSLADLLGGLFPCQTDFGAPCIPLGSDFTTVSGTPNPAAVANSLWLDYIWQLMNPNLLSLNGPPILCYQGQCPNSNLDSATPSVTATAVQQSTWYQARGACTYYATEANNGFGNVGADSANASIWNGTKFQQYTQYPRPTTMNPSAPSILVLGPLASPSLYFQASYQQCMGALGF